MIHSPRAARRFGELINDRDKVVVGAISDAAAQALGDGWERVEIAEQPTNDALLALAARLCENSQPR